MAIFSGVGMGTLYATGVTCYASHCLTNAFFHQNFDDISDEQYQRRSTGRKIENVVLSFFCGAVIGALLGSPLLVVAIASNIPQFGAIAMIYSATIGGMAAANFWVQKFGVLQLPS